MEGHKSYAGWPFRMQRATWRSSHAGCLRPQNGTGYFLSSSSRLPCFSISTLACSAILASSHGSVTSITA